MQHANQKHYTTYATCKKTQYNSATCKSKHYTTIKTTNIMQHANQNITLL